MSLLAQATYKNFWFWPNGSTELWKLIALAFALSIAGIFALTRVPPRGRTMIVTAVTFVSGLFYVLFYFWPSPVGREPATMPNGPSESVGFFLEDALQRVADFTTILTAFLLGLGAYSVVRIHGRKIVKRQPDWGFSVVLFVSLLCMVGFGYVDFATRLRDGGKLQIEDNWTTVNYGFDLLFDGFLQQMDAAMFSLIAFYILSAAYRAFRIRSMEATILLAGALIMILGLMGWVSFQVDNVVGSITHHDAGSFWNNLKLSGLSDWLRINLMTSSLRAIDFGVGIGLLAMGLRLWLSLEKIGGTSNA